MIITDPKLVDSETLVVRRLDDVNFILENVDMEFLKWIKKQFTYRIENWRFHPKVQAGVWDGRISYLNIADRTFPIGLLDLLVEKINGAKYKMYLDIDKHHFHDYAITYSAVRDFCVEVMKDAPFDWEERDYQIDCIYQSLKYKRGIIEASVGAGKSWVIYIMIKWMIRDPNRKIILVVPSTMLVEQMVGDWFSYGWPALDMENTVELLYDGKRPTFGSQVLITTWQSVYKRGTNFFAPYNVLLFDEAHTAKAESLLGISKKCVNCDIRTGFTGTLPDEIIDVMNIFAYLGAVRRAVSSAFLQKIGVLSQIKICIAQLDYPIKIKNIASAFNYPGMMDFIVEYPPRYRIIMDIYRRFVRPTDNVLVLAQKKEHIAQLVKEFSKLVPAEKIKVIHGNIKNDVRTEIRNGMEFMDGGVLIATYQTVGAGMNVKKLHHVFFASPYRSKIKVIQALGRGLRTHKTKACLYLWDISDNFGTGRKNFTMSQMKDRIKEYVKQKFPYKIMKFNVSDYDDSPNSPFLTGSKSIWKK